MDSSPTRSYSSTKQLLPNDVEGLISTNNRNKVAPTIRDVLLTLGNSMVAGVTIYYIKMEYYHYYQHYVLWWKAQLIQKISLTNLILIYRNINNVTINNLLTGVSFATAPLLPLAVA